MNWGIAASLATAIGTLVLAVATFLSIRTAIRSNRTADRALRQGLRPILLPSLYTDPIQKIRYVDDHWLQVPGGRGVLDVTPTAAYLGLSVRNIGPGPAVIDGWDVLTTARDHRRPIRDYHLMTRDLYVPAGAHGYVQIAGRDPAAPAYACLARAAQDPKPFAVDVLYGDIDESQHYVIRIALTVVPGAGDDGRVWALNEVRHWTLSEAVPARHET